jgi:hypothetical protein
MRTQTKCTWGLIGLAFVELLQIPFTSIYSLVVVRKRSLWLPGLVERLYEDKEVPEGEVDEQPPIKEGHDPMVTRRRCTISLSFLLFFDLSLFFLVVPITLSFALFIVRRRPAWFKNVVARLYSDQPGENADDPGSAEPVENDPVYNKVLEQKHLELQQRNFDFARSIGGKEE